MNKKVICAASAIVAAFAIAGCGQSNGDGGINVAVGVAGLQDTQHFCFTWSLYQQAPGGWTLVDSESDPICAPNGVDVADSFATCYDGRKFIVVYEVTYYGEDGVLGTATGTSGGGEDDICVKNADVATSVLFQFRNEGNAGGADLYVDIDQVCTNDKIVIEDGRVISAVWVQEDSCIPGPPDGYCVLRYGCTLQTVRFGITADGQTRFLFSESDTSGTWGLYFMFFEDPFPADTLVLLHSPYLLHHELDMGQVDRDELHPGVVFRYDAPAGIGVGFVKLKGDQLEVFYDLTGDCNAGTVPDASLQVLAAPCDGALLGAIPAGGSAFTLVMQCSAGGFQFVNCDARGVTGGICTP